MNAINKMIEAMISFGVLNEKNTENFKYYAFIFMFFYLILAFISVIILLLIKQFYDINYKQCVYILLPLIVLFPTYISINVKKENQIQEIRDNYKTWTNEDKKKIRNNGIVICIIMLAIPLIHFIYILIRYYNQ